MAYMNAGVGEIRKVDTYRRAPMSGSSLGEVCPPCYVNSGSECSLCPDDASDFPECAGCVNGVRASLVSAASQSIVAPVVAGVLTTLLVAWLSSKILDHSSP
jgi:hypothetical protein